MVDVTFIFILLLGGPLVGLTTARVRGHRGWRKSADIAGGFLFGMFGHALWIKFVQTFVNTGPGRPTISREWAFFLSDVLWFSPVIGSLAGMVVIAILWRLSGLPLSQPRDNAGQKIGASLRIVGWTYTVISVAMILVLVALAVSLGTTEALSGVLSLGFLKDLLLGPAVVLVGWIVSRLFRPAQPEAPSAS